MKYGDENDWFALAVRFAKDERSNNLPDSSDVDGSKHVIDKAARGKISVARRVVRNALIDMRFGVPLGVVYIRNRKQSNSDYRELETIFEGRIDAEDVLVDVGCGAGRVINQWLRVGVENQIYGLEIDERLGASTRRRLRRHSNVSIVTGDAVTNLPSDGTLFFLFNPFDEATMGRFAAAIVQLAEKTDRVVRVYYLNCKHVAVFQDDTNFVVDVMQLESSDSGSGQQFATVTVR